MYKYFLDGYLPLKITLLRRLFLSYAFAVSKIWQCILGAKVLFHQVNLFFLGPTAFVNFAFLQKVSSSVNFMNGKTKGVREHLSERSSLPVLNKRSEFKKKYPDERDYQTWRAWSTQMFEGKILPRLPTGLFWIRKRFRLALNIFVYWSTLSHAREVNKQKWRRWHFKKKSSIDQSIGQWAHFGIL